MARIREVTAATTDVDVDEALQGQQNPAYEPPDGMRLDTRTNELVPIEGWSFPADAHTDDFTVDL